ncbi:MAG: tetratricopeptide repeat protein [Pseudomonadota bacterium]
METPPEDPMARALAHHRAGELAEAAGLYREMLAADPDRLAPLVNLASILRGGGRVDEAEGLLRRAIALAPGTPGLNRNLGNLLFVSGRPEAALAAHRAELAMRPDDEESQLGVARSLLVLGQFEEGWRALDSRPERAKAVARGLTGPEWRGEDLAGKRLFIWPEQGFGDQIIMMRYVPLLGGDVTMVVMPQLLRLFAQLPARLIAHDHRVAAPAYDYWTLPLSLPLCLGTGGDLVTAPYLSAAPRETGKRVGIAWRGNALPDPNRSLPRDVAAMLLALPGAMSLDPEDTGVADFQDTAEIIAGLDLVISIDTSVAHLAGAMGKPVWVLHQQRPPEWRWRTDGDGRSVWYPTARVLTQATQGDWSAVVEQVKADWPVRG